MNNLVEQDPQAKIYTTSAKSETTQTTTVNSTIYDDNRKRITFQSTRQTIINYQAAAITEITILHTPNSKELGEMLTFMHMKDEKRESKPSTSTSTTASTSSTASAAATNNSKWRRQYSDELAILEHPSQYMNSVPNKQTTEGPKDAHLNVSSPVNSSIFSFDINNKDEDGLDNDIGSDDNINKTLKTPKTPTLVKIIDTDVVHENHFMYTERLEEQSIKSQLSTMKLISTSTPTSTPTTTITFTFTTASATTSATTNDSCKFQCNIYETPLAKSAPINCNSAYNLRTVSHINKKNFIRIPAKQPIKTDNNCTLSIAANVAIENATPTTELPFCNSFRSIQTIAPLSRAYNTKSISMNTPIMVASGKVINGPVLNPGCAYIFNNIDIDQVEYQQCLDRIKDVKALKDTFEYFKLNVNIIEYDKLDMIGKVIEKVKNMNFTNEACLVVVILSHGLRCEEEIFTNADRYSINNGIFNTILKNPTLIDKPKLFFVQTGKVTIESPDIGNLVCKNAAILYRTLEPITMNNTLKCFSTFEGFLSDRNVKAKKGSMFIQLLCQNLKLFGCTKSIEDIIQLVIKIVKPQSNNKRVPAVICTLTKPFVFGDYVKWCK